MTDQEKLDLEELKARTRERKLQCFDFCVHLLRLPDDQLKFTGHKSKEHAIVSAVTGAQKEIESWGKAHIRKYPDER